MEEILKEILDILKDNKLSNIISILSLIVAIIAVVITVISNAKNNKIYVNSLKPMLAFKLYERNGFLVLSIKNNGQSEATNININFLELNNNEKSEFILDDIFKKEFMLYPTEETQGLIAINSSNIDKHSFPNVKIRIKYIEGNDNKEITYERSIVYKKEIQIKDSIEEVAEEIRSIAYSNNRMANYIEGRTLFKFDELNVMPKSSLYRDIKDAINNIKREENDENDE